METYGYIIYRYCSFGFDEPLDYYWSGTVDYPTDEDAKEAAEDTLRVIERDDSKGRYYVWPICQDTRNRQAMLAMSQAPV